ncbi:single-stranded DNA-binding protein [Patescibacteria group bacterium]|nr:single-stranded DNA-binding protein [Patescibacteria group bacterium]MBU4482187.1 single-stranded DNA-binding protein [Patescibacteria group bacterium]
MNLNKAILIGRVTRDPEMRTIPSGQNVAHFSLATNRVWNKDGQKQEAVEFHNIVAWSRLAEIVSQYVKKGILLMIEGRIQTRTWQAQDGTNKNRTEIVAENIQLGPRAAGQGGGSYTPSTGSPAPAYAKASEGTPSNPAPQGDSVPTINLDEQGNPVDETPTGASEPVEDANGEPPEAVMPF